MVSTFSDFNHWMRATRSIACLTVALGFLPRVGALPEQSSLDTGHLALAFVGTIPDRCSQKEDYFVAFVGREASNGSRAGHAFVIIGKGTPMTCDVEHGDGEAFGFYPSSSNNPCEPGPQPTGKDILLKPVPGCLINDLYTPYSNWVTIRCSFEDYLMVIGVIEEWKKRPYRLGQQDCLSFLMEVANLFDDRLGIPERAGLDMFPNRFVLRMKDLNP